jgi:hypothetical protein
MRIVRWTIERTDGSRIEVRDRIDQRGFHNWIVKVKDRERRTQVVWHVVFSRAWEAVHGPEEKYRRAQRHEGWPPRGLEIGD